MDLILFDESVVVIILFQTGYSVPGWESLELTGLLFETTLHFFGQTQLDVFNLTLSCARLKSSFDF